MKLGELLKNENINVQLFAFFNTRLKRGGGGGFGEFEIRSFYKVGKFLGEISENLKQNFAQKTNENLQNYSNLPFNCEKFGRHSVKIFNDLNLGIDEYFMALYKNIMLLRYKNYNEAQFEKALLNAIFGLNGSADFSLNLYAVDICANYCTKKYFELYFKLILHINQNFLNLNFRNLQPQFINGTNKRNMQFRVKLAYFSQNNADLNPFKSEILARNFDKITPLSHNSESQNSVLERFDFYAKYILNKSALNVKKLRQELEFDAPINESGSYRKVNIITMARNILPDLCAACNKKYDINDRTFRTRSGFYYLEIHHNIAFAFNQNCDEFDNLVKLCPTCHRALSKNRADENFQKELIKNILEFSPTALEFAKILSQKNSQSEIINFIYETLK